MDLVCGSKWEDTAKGEGEKKREKRRERERSLIIISLIAFYGSLNALGSHSGS